MGTESTEAHACWTIATEISTHTGTSAIETRNSTHRLAINRPVRLIDHLIDHLIAHLIDLIMRMTVPNRQHFGLEEIIRISTECVTNVYAVTKINYSRSFIQAIS